MVAPTRTLEATIATSPEEVSTEEEAPAEGVNLLAQIAQTDGDISGLLAETALATLGEDVVRDYELDLQSREDWEKGAREGMKRAAQERIEAENPPPYRKSFVNFPLLTIAAQQFNARSYPAICKTGSIVKVKTIGSDKGRPVIGPDGQQAVIINGQPMSATEAAQAMAQAQQAAPTPQAPAEGQQLAQAALQMPPPQPMWEIPPGAKQKRADRVAGYLNVYIEFRMDDWEEDTDDLLNQIPIVGCGFRKMWWDALEHKQCAAYVSALDLVVPNTAKTLDTSPRITEKMPDVFPFQIRERINSGFYREVLLPQIGEDAEGPRLLLEQHRLEDLDGDGVDEPYIVTVDYETRRILRVEADFTVDDVVMDAKGTSVIKIRRQCYYVKYPFLPSFKGGFYNAGFGHLLEQLGDIVNTCINQTFDAAHAAIAGGGFIASGLRLQGNNRSDTIRWMPGEYKQVSVNANDLRSGIVERTFPNPSPIVMSLLELMLGAAKDITSVKDVMTGEASNTAPVGTTLALIEQGLQVFTAIYKRVYRSLGKEFRVTFDNIARFGGEEVAQDYDTVMDDPEADFEKDFADGDMDIKPVADPSSVTKMQQMAKAQFLLGMRGTGLNDMEINRRALEAAGIEDIDALMPQGPAQPDPLTLAKARQAWTAADLNIARAQQASATAAETGVKVGHALADGTGDYRGLGGLAGASGNAMDAQGTGGPGL